MTWLAPWAWLGLVALVVPLLVHLLSRHRARVQQFPTLRFLDAAVVTPTRRTRLNDLLLLAVRFGVLTAAVAALAQPLLRSSRGRSSRSTGARAVILDTSASMRRATSSGGTALDAARREARRAAREGATSIIVETSAPSREIAGANAWIGSQSGPRALVVVSDFQAGALDGRDLASIGSDIGVQLTRVAVTAGTGPVESHARVDGEERVARMTLMPDRTDVEWTARTSADSNRADDRVTLLTGAGERASAAAAKRAARTTVGPPTGRPDHLAAVVYPQFETRAALITGAMPLDAPWMADAVARVRHDAMLHAVTSSADLSRVQDASLAGPPFVVVARTDSGRPVVVAARGTVDGHARLIFFSMAGAGSLSSAALLAATSRALAETPAVSELDPSYVADSELKTWERPVGTGSPAVPEGSDASQGRWLWLLALVLLGVEALVRSRSAAPRTGEVISERLA
jgi:hypothetical protein